MAYVGKTLKDFDKTRVYTVSGYFRRVEAELADSNSPLFQSVPPLILLTTLQFYAHEYFAIVGASHTKLSNDGRTITKIKDNLRNTSYGNMCIASTSGIKCRWTLQIGEFYDYGFAIGICSDYQTDIRFVDNAVSSNYALCALSYTMSKTQRNDSYGKEWRRDSKIGVELDMHERTLMYYLDGNCLGVAYKDIDVGEDIVYRLAVYVYQRGVPVTLLDFEILKR